MALGREEFEAIKQRAEELVGPFPSDFPPEKYPPEGDPLVQLLGQLKQDNYRLVEEVERLWRERPDE
jgi:hypothetical protein